MEITNIKLKKLFWQGKLKGIVTVTFDDAFVVHDLKIVEGKSGLFIAMPGKKISSDGSFKDIAHPINSEMRNKIQTAVLKVYEDAMKEQNFNAIALDIEEN